MAQCVDVVNVSGQDVLTPVAASSGACVTALVLTPSEYSTLMASPFVLTPDEAVQLSLAVCLLWAVAYGFRAFIRTLQIDEKESES